MKGMTKNLKEKLIIQLFSLFTPLFFTPLTAQQVIDLAGSWHFRMGELPDTVFDNEHKLIAVEKAIGAGEFVMLPGSMLTNGKGLPVNVNTQWTGSLYDSSYYFNPYMERYRNEGNMKLPFFLTPERHYVGTAWYGRSIYVPEYWKGNRITLFLERPHIETTVYVNGQEVGHQTSLSTPHVYDVTKMLKIGQRNEIAIRVYNGIENVCVGQDSHSVTDQTQGNWNGIVGRIELQARPKHVNIRRVRVYPNLKQRKAHVVVDLENHANQGLGTVHVMQQNVYGISYDVTMVGVDSEQLVYSTSETWNNLVEGENTEQLLISFLSNWINIERKTHVEFDIRMTNKMLAWDEFTPAVYRLRVYAGDDEYETTFGFRDISIEGRQMMINNHPLFIRGTVENCCFPETGYPPTDEKEWIRIFKKCKEYGLNMMRFHSYCPPEAAFAAADRMGIYLQPEGPSWPNHGVKLKRGMAIDQYLLDESRRIIDTYGNHPSFVMMAAGNEPAGDWVTYCDEWVRQMHEYDSTKVYCGASVGGGWAWDGGSEYHVKGGARGLDWDRHAPSSDDDYYEQILHPKNYRPTPQTLPVGRGVYTSEDSTKAESNYSPPSRGGAGGGSFNNSPIIAHEQGQWCAFPDLKESSQYTGVYKARNFEIFSDLLRDNGMASQAKKFLEASGRLQTLCYKYEIERNLRTPDYTGFQLLSLNDYSGQGTALVGPLNIHWKEKGYVNAKQWRKFCNVVVPLARFPRFVYTNADTLRVPIEVYNSFNCILTHARTSYYVINDTGKVYAGGIISTNNLPIAKNIPMGTVVMPLNAILAPQKLKLVVRVSNAIQNEWDFWVYPSPGVKGAEFSDFSTDVADEKSLNTKLSTLNYIADSLDTKALDVLSRGGTVLLTAAGRVTLGSDVKQTYLPVFWNTSWFKMRPPHTTGAYIDTSHPLFCHGFPTDSWANLNWWELLNKAQVMNLMELPADYQPPIQPIDTWHVSRKLGMLIEARVGKGRLLMTTMDITSDLDRRHVARQMRHAIIDYMQSSDFQPSLTLDVQTIRDFFTKQAPPVDMFTKDSPDELKPKLTTQ